MGSEKHVEHVSMSSAEKRYKPSKHYVFVLQVTWNDGSTFPVFRKYSEFYELHIELVDQFPKEAGFGGTRTLPYLPGKKFLRSESEKVAAKRKGPLEDYCRGLLKLEEYISRHELVMDFFRTRYEDINPPKDATKKPDRSRLFAALGLVFPKLLRKDSKDRLNNLGDTSPDDLYVSGPVNFDTYYVISDYVAQARGEISLEEGQEVEVVEKNDNGWWFISFGTEQGWAPASFLEPVNTAHELDEPEPLYNGETYMTLEAYEGELEDEISFPKDVIVEAIHKLLDGWWIISYDGKVGHAPATYLQRYDNPHFNKTALKNYKPKKVRAPTQRKCTIKNRNSRWVDKRKTEKKDMTMYRKMSVKIAQSRRRKQAGAEPQSKPPFPPNRPKKPSIVEEEDDDQELYINNEEAVTLASRGGDDNSWKCPFPQPRYPRSPSPPHEDKLEDYTEIDECKMEDMREADSPDYEINDFTSDESEDDQEYINVTTVDSKTTTSKSAPYSKAPTNKAKQTNPASSSQGGLGNLFATSVPIPTAQPRTAKPAKDAYLKPSAPNRSGAKDISKDSPKPRHKLHATPLLQAAKIGKTSDHSKPNVRTGNTTPTSANQKQGHSGQSKPKGGGIMAQRLAQFGN